MVCTLGSNHSCLLLLFSLWIYRDFSTWLESLHVWGESHIHSAECFTWLLRMLVMPFLSHGASLLLILFAQPLKSLPGTRIQEGMLNNFSCFCKWLAIARKLTFNTNIHGLERRLRGQSHPLLFQTTWIWFSAPTLRLTTICKIIVPGESAPPSGLYNG